MADAVETASIRPAANVLRRVGLVMGSAVYAFILNDL